HEVLQRGVPRAHPHHRQRHHPDEGADGRQLRPPGVAVEEVPRSQEAARVKIHEYQAKALLREFGVAVPRGDVAETPARAREIAQRLGGKVVVKAQVHAGGRGKAGGIQLADGPSAAEAAAKQLLGMRLRTPQTPPEGVEVRRVLVEEAAPVRAELYLAVTLDRERSTEVVIASQ